MKILGVIAGAILVIGAVIFFVILPPRVDAVCPIGAGDALNAALVWSITNGRDFLDSVRWGATY